MRFLTLFLIQIAFFKGYSQERMEPFLKIGGYFSYSQQILGQDNFIVHSRSSRYNTGYRVVEDRVYTTKSGILFEHDINNNVYLQAGLGVSKQKFDALYVCPVCDPAEEEIRLKYVEIPISVFRSWTDGNIRPITGLGLVSRFKQVGRYERDFSLDSNMSVGLGVYPTKKIEFRLLGIFSLAIVSPYPKYYSNKSLGLSASLLFDIGRQ
ncbi:MAG: hypothetical protein CMP48_07940 [Rickettsiales bacterium]|nr:hypothetical protein [Rickettsiales bacterium]|tara:strand:- start:1130 stop:1756 length:627 start_codon:yes stop_codon:yes gene_type:complete